ncbi:MAG: hypothetical protein ACRDP8_04880, partial [Actinopolymorphaceae bacterium]
ELVVVLSPARDRTERIALTITASDPRVRLVEAAADSQSGELSAAIREATYDLIVRVDGRGMLGPGYLRRAVEVVEGTSTGEQNELSPAPVPTGESAFGEAAARAMTSRLGIDGGTRQACAQPTCAQPTSAQPTSAQPTSVQPTSARQASARPNKTTGRTGPMDAVYLGVFRRGDRTRDGQVHHAGGTVWFTPETRVSHRPRPTPRTLARQYYLNGQWHHALRRRYPSAFGGRTITAPGAVIGCLLALAVAAVGLLAMSVPLLVGGLAVPTLCVLVSCVGAAFAGRGLSAGGRLWLPVALLLTHLAWGAGFLTSPPFLGHPVVGRTDAGTAGDVRPRHDLTMPTSR